MKDFINNEVYENEITECAELIRSGKFVPEDNETFEMLKQMYATTKYKPIENMLQGTDCYIIGSGASLKDFDFNAIYGKGYILAINHSAKYCNSDAIIFIDEKFYYQSKEFLQEYKGTIFASWQSNYWLNALTSATVYYFSTIREKTYNGRLHSQFYKGLYDSGNTGLCAIHLAIIMGAKNIYLLGYDLDSKAKEKHFYDENGVDKFSNGGNYKKVEKMASLIERHSKYFGKYSHIYNCNPNSKIECYKKIAIEGEAI
jgi:hypothetical protein